MIVKHKHNGKIYTLSNEGLKVNDKVYPISRGKVTGNTYEHWDFDFRDFMSGFPDEPHTLLDLHHSDYKPYEARTYHGYSPIESYFKVIEVTEIPKLVYLASPYSHPDDAMRKLNFVKVSMLAAKLASEGHVVLSPITYGHTLVDFHEMPTDWPFWENFCITILSKCDKLLVYKMEGWDKSKGVAAEIEYAMENNIPVEYIEYTEKD